MHTDANGKIVYDNPKIRELSDTILEIHVTRFEGMLYQLLKDMDDAVTDWDITVYLFQYNYAVTIAHLSFSSCEESKKFYFLHDIVAGGLQTLANKGLIKRDSDRNNKVWNSIKELKLDERC